MPQNTNLTINDGAATPVAHAFVPVKIDNQGVAHWAERTGLTIIGWPKFTLGIREPAVGGGKGGKSYKTTLMLKQPKVITTTDVSGKTVTSIDYENSGKIELMVSPSSTAQERKDLRVMLANALLNATVASSLDNVETFW